MQKVSLLSFLAFVAIFGSKVEGIADSCFLKGVVLAQKPTLYTKTVEECQAVCREREEGCDFFTYSTDRRSKIFNQGCTINPGPTHYPIVYAPSLQTGTKFEILPDKNVAYVNQLYTGIKDFLKCRSICLSDSRCVTWIWSGEGPEDSNYCVLNYGGDQNDYEPIKLRRGANVVSGFSFCPSQEEEKKEAIDFPVIIIPEPLPPPPPGLCIEEKAIYVPGPSIVDISYDLCFETCFKSETCKYFTWSPELAGSCGLRETEPTNLVNAMTLSTGTNTIPIVNKNVVLVNKAIKNVSTYMECFDHCEKDPKCLTWTWGTGDSMDKYVCVLDYNKPEKIIQGVDNVYSGKKYCTRY